MRLPIIKQIGMDPIHFGVILTVNISIGALYPPVGELLFVTSRIGKVSYYDISKAIMPMVILLIGLLFLVSLVPETVLYLPRRLCAREVKLIFGGSSLCVNHGIWKESGE